MFIGKIEFHGGTWEDALDAVDAALGVMLQGPGEASNHWEGGGFKLTTLERPDVPRETSTGK